ncbi:MAG: hypothetical protein IJH00_06260 [Erysipelotrichaceae bacterium]|nr:hypothetical protein [Erysipelotrichaceae bacterium]
MRLALTTIAHILESTGMNRIETNQLLARFLQEEAFDYVECMKDDFKQCDHPEGFPVMRS